MDLENMRREYLQGGLSRAQLSENPVEQFRLWFAQVTAVNLCDPSAMVLATIGESGVIRQRTVLLKQLDDSGFMFFTNYGSAKAADIAVNPNVSLHFPWHALERQVMVQGIAEKLETAQSAQYFSSRPRDSQIAAWASRQSQPIASRKDLEERFEHFRQQFSNGAVPVPDFWGGYRVKPQRFEFWQGRASRLHDRFEYRLEAGSWRIDRLAP